MEKIENLWKNAHSIVSEQSFGCFYIAHWNKSMFISDAVLPIDKAYASKNQENQLRYLISTQYAHSEAGMQKDGVCAAGRKPRSARPVWRIASVHHGFQP